MLFLLRNNYSFKKISLHFYLCLTPVGFSAQGLVNNGTHIVFTGAAQLYIDGTDGNYTSQSSGSITPNSTSTITLEGNWVNNSSNVAFTTDAGVVILAGAAQTVGGSNPSAFYNLSLTGNDIKTLAVNSTTVGGQSTFTGILSLGSSTLDLNGNRIDITNSATGAITRSSGYIISETSAAVNPSAIRWYHRTAGGSRVYPFGVGGSYIPFTFSISATMTNTAGYVEVSTRATNTASNIPWAGTSNLGGPVSHMFSPNGNFADGSSEVVIDRWWDITNSDPVTADITFSYRGTENTLSAPYNIGFVGPQYWDGTAWISDNLIMGGGASLVSGGTIGNVTALGVDKFCPWILSASLSPLPIELINFEANCINTDILLEWCTASENNNDFFTIEQSINDFDYQTIAKIYGNGTTQTKNCYKLSASSISSEINYFRLSQTDNNKKTKVLKTVSIESCDEAKGHILIASNGSRKISVILNSASDQQLQLQIHNTLGQLVEMKDLEAVKGYNNIPVDLTNVSNELYYVSVFDTTEKLISKKIVITDLNN